MQYKIETLRKSKDYKLKTLHSKNRVISICNDPIVYEINRQPVNITINNEVFVSNVVSLNAAEDINSYTPVAIVDNLIYKFDANNLDHMFAFLGFSKTSVVSGNVIDVQKNGIISLVGWGLDQGDQYLSSSSGNITKQTTSESFRKVIGYAVDSDSLKIINDYIPLKIN